MFDFPGREGRKKWATLMRISTFILLLLTMTLPSIATSQISRISVSVQNVTLDEAIREVRKKTNYRFLYQVEEVNKYGTRNIELQNAGIEDFLKILLKDTSLDYEIEDEVIIIHPKKERQQPQTRGRTIHGIVRDEQGEVLPGATITLKGTQLGVVSDVNGKFKLNIPEDSQVTLFVSFIGMVTQEKTVKSGEGNESSPILILMAQDVTQVDEVVITGYANIRKKSFTGNSVSVDRKELLNVSKTNVISALEAFDPSFRIQTNNDWGSDPNALPEMYIRGRSGIGVKDLDRSDLTKSALKDNPNLPTFILDGFEITVEQLYDMDINRIENITILKDAAATALYGSRAANGVVVISSVAPQPGKLNISYNLTGLVTMPDLSDYNLMNAEEKLEAERLAGLFHSNDPLEQIKKEKQYYNKKANVIRGVDTYWLSLPLRTAFNHKHSLSFDGGTPNFRFGAQLSYYNENGVMKKSYRNRIGFGLTLDYRINSLQIRNNITYDITRNQDSPYGNFSEYTKALPYNVYKDENGNYLEALESWGELGSMVNPLYESTLHNFTKASSESLVNNLNVIWYVTDHLQLRGQLSVTRGINNSKRFLDPLSKRNTNELSDSNPSSGELYLSDGKSFSWDMVAAASYNRSVNDHNINFQMVVNSRSQKNESTSSEYRGFPSGLLNSPNYAKEIYSKPSSSENTTRLIGFMGALNYSFRDIYLFDASVRFDGSSEFGEDRRFAPFWSTGAGINIHQYEFFKKQNILDYLKIRASFGQTGKVNFPPYVARTSYEVLFDEWYKQGFGATLQALGNTDLSWETTNKFDAGFELGLKKQRLTLTASWYNEKTIDLVNTVTIPSSTGFTTYMDNIGEVRNYGFELSARSVVFNRKEFYLSLFGNLGHNKNEILKISESLRAYNRKVDEHFQNSNKYDGSNTKPFTKYVEGGSLTSIFAVQSLGIDPSSGEEIFLNNDGTTTKTWQTDQQIVAGNTEPKASGSFGLNARYKQLSLYVTFRYEFGGQQYNKTLVDKVEDARIYDQNVDKRVLSDRWKEAGDMTKYKKINTGGTILRTRPTTRFVQDNDFISLNSLNLGYDFTGQNWMKTVGLSLLRLEIGANELGRWSTIKTERGLNYPYAHTMNFSVRATF